MDLVYYWTSDQHNRRKLWQTREKHMSEPPYGNKILLSKPVSYKVIHQALRVNILGYVYTLMAEYVIS